METYTLSNGVTIPKIGFGTWQIPEGEEAYNSVSFALKAGYTHIDTAQIYGNEVSVGKAIADSDVAREDIFLTTKLWNDKHDYELAKASIDESLERLGVDYLDLLLIHWPNPKALRENDAWKAGNAGAWKAMEEAYKDPDRWAKMALLNTASCGKFTSDRTIQEYVDNIWKLDYVTVKPEA